ncbi:hypothetical protein [Actinoplanes sp. NPDC049118]|uniref:hypothetical protein n=1 Tax=Actinoplanes sp. NPDC049118 TaxID=3155769 RepID=UPI0033CE03F0
MNGPEPYFRASRLQNRRLLGLAAFLAGLLLSFTAWVNTSGTMGDQVCKGVPSAWSKPGAGVILHFCLGNDRVTNISDRTP